MTEPEIGVSAFDWDENDELQQQNKETESALLERAKAYHHLFAQDKIGQKVLGEWINMYCTGGVPSAGASEREVGMRDGKQQLIQMIIQQINVASGERK